VPQAEERNPTSAWTTRTLIAWIESSLGERGIDQPDLVARWLVASAIGTDPIHLYTDLDRPASVEERDTLRGLVHRAMNHEPVQYLLGEAGFLGRRFDVGPGVLIPRTATETMVQHVVTWHGGLDHDVRPDPFWIADVCTGTGCVGLSLAHRFEQARVVLTDVDEAALGFARGNRRRHGLEDRVEVRQGDLYQPLETDGDVSRFHVIVSNPPYIADAAWAELAPNVKDHEPALALRGGTDGLDLVRRLISEAPCYLHSGGLLMIEVDSHHASAASELAEATAELHDVKIIRDEFGDDRFVCALRSG